MTITDNGTDGIEAQALTSAGGGGRIDVSVGGTLAIKDPILADSGASGPVSGGQISIRAGGDILTDDTGHISAYGREGGGGSIEVVSETGDVVLYEHLKAEGLGHGADGGSVEVSAGNLLNVAAELSVKGGVNVSGSKANGGSIALVSGCGGTTIAANLLATGGEGGGQDIDSGGIEIESRGNLVVTTGVTLDTRALQSGGSGGVVNLRARDLIDLQGTAKIDARGSSAAPGRGGDVLLQSCRLLVGNGSTIDVTGSAGGVIALRAGKEPPATNGATPQPMTIGTTSVLRAAGATSADNGLIELAPLRYKPGVCSNSGTTACELDTDCTIGCQTGECNYANPDTAGLNTQFDILPVRQQEADATECQDTCN